MSTDHADGAFEWVHDRESDNHRPKNNHCPFCGEPREGMPYNSIGHHLVDCEEAPREIDYYA